MRKKIFALAICLAFGICMLTGCGGTNSSSAGQEPADDGSTTQATAETDSGDTQA